MTVPRREREDLRGLLFAQLEQVAAREHLAVLVAQPLERCEQLRALLRGEQASLGGRSRAPRGKLVCGAQGEALAAPAARRRLRASFATIASSQGAAARRDGSAATRATPSTRPVWTASSASAALRAIR